jgi:hypothetical protein
VTDMAGTVVNEFTPLKPEEGRAIDGYVFIFALVTLDVRA